MMKNDEMLEHPWWDSHVVFFLSHLLDLKGRSIN